jgi:DNA-binding NarL/FixJ family response regulator
MRLLMDVMLADDQPEVRSALRLLLEQTMEMKVISEPSDTEELLQQLRLLQPHLLLLDWELPGAEMSDLIAQALVLRPGLKIIALSGYPEARCEADLLGISAFASKGDPPEAVIVAVLEALGIRKPHDASGGGARSGMV